MRALVPRQGGLAGAPYSLRRREVMERLQTTLYYPWNPGNAASVAVCEFPVFFVPARHQYRADFGLLCCGHLGTSCPSPENAGEVERCKHTEFQARLEDSHSHSVTTLVLASRWSRRCSTEMSGVD